MKRRFAPSGSTTTAQVADQNHGNEKGKVDKKKEDDDYELINLGRVQLKETPPFAIGIAYSFTPFVFGVFLLLVTGSPIDEVAGLLVWHVWVWYTAYSPKPMWQVAGAIQSFITLVGGVMLTHRLSNRWIRVQYVMATVMFASGRGNVLANDLYLSSLPLSFRGAYVFSFLDLGKARYYRDLNEVNQQKQENIKTLVVSVLGMLLTLAGVAILDMYDPTGLLEQSVIQLCKIACGAFNFMFFIYVGDIVYQIPILYMSPSPELTLKPQPLMINPFRSKTVSEFWSSRWDTGMQSVLYSNAYRPVRKLGFSRGTAMFATFALSGAIHCPLVTELEGPMRDTALMFSFFIAQACIIALESKLKLPPSTTRTLIMCSLPAPLFVVPFLALLGY